MVGELLARSSNGALAKIDQNSNRIIEIFDEVIKDWWIKSFSGNPELFTPPQRLAIPLIHKGKNVLICAPTGSGKTLSAFISILNELFIMAKQDALENSVYCLYISPLKSIANDIYKNLEKPLSDIHIIAHNRGLRPQEIRHAIRHGDISSQVKSRMLKKTPHILNTTPESFSILLSAPQFRNKLKTVRWVIVDEIHTLAGSKRGVHLSISLERLEELKKELNGSNEFLDIEAGSFVRIGCSATIAPLQEIAAFLAGNDRPIEIVDKRFSRHFDLRLLCPVPDLTMTTSTEMSDRLYEIVHRHIQEHDSTLIFANTRNGAERILYNLRSRYPEYYGEENSGCHHGSMGKEGRLETEDKLKEGSLKVVCSSTSLELGIDMPHLDLVLQIGSPKSVAALLQRIGRAGHSLDQVVKGRIITLDQDELIECAVMLEQAKAGFVDEIHIPANCLDVLCQQLIGLALDKTRNLADIQRLVKRSYCYRNLKHEEMMCAMDYLAGRYAGLEERHIYAKIWYDPKTQNFGKKGRNARLIYYANSGTIPDQFSCNVFTREGCWVGNLDDKYLEKLDIGDVFVIGGKNCRFCYRRGGKIYVDFTTDRANIPNWVSERLPLSFDLGKKVLQFKNDLLWMIKAHSEDEVVEWLQKHYPIDKNSSHSIYKIFQQQIRYLDEDSVPTDWRFIAEEVLDKERQSRVYYFLTGYGLRFNEGLSRIIAYLVSKEEKSNACVSVNDNGFMISLPAYKKVDILQIIRSIKEDNCVKLLENALESTQLLKNVFRINACRSFMILRSYRGKKMSARKQQVSADMLIYFARQLDNFAVLKESYREIIEDKFEIANIKEIIGAIQSGEMDLILKRANSPSPMAFGIATASASDVVYAEDKLNLLKEFHRRVMRTIEGRTEATGDRIL